ncbi:MAG: hypothetical protein Q8L87_03220 [Anaerolineales bacterium]|nr:hypothetical protein [Anaerolineales bacterium]
MYSDFIKIDRGRWTVDGDIRGDKSPAQYVEVGYKPTGFSPKGFHVLRQDFNPPN